MDRVTKFLAHEGRVSLICASTTDLVEEIRNIHDLTPTTTAALGRFATIAGMMGLTEIKDEEQSITIQMNGKGPMGTLLGVVKRSDNTSKIKVCADNPYVEIPLKDNGKLDVGTAIGTDGYLNIINKNEITDTDYSGLVPIVSGEIAEDFTEYFAKSQQKPTVIALGVLVNKDGVKAAGGYMIQLMPDATEEDITKIENALENAPSISQMIDEGKSLEEIAMTVSGDDNITVLEEMVPKFSCDCSRERMEQALKTISEEERKKMIEQDGCIEMKCSFCGRVEKW